MKTPSDLLEEYNRIKSKHAHAIADRDKCKKVYKKNLADLSRTVTKYKIEMNSILKKCVKVGIINVPRKKI